MSQIQLNPLIDANTLAHWLVDPSAGKPLILDCRFNLADTAAGKHQYLEKHLPGAAYAHLDRDLSGTGVPGQTGRHPLPRTQDWQTRLRDWGVSQDTAIVVYDQNNGMFAARAWWLLRWAGLTNVRVLNGGLDAWHGPQQSGTVELPNTTGDISVTCPPDWVISSSELQASLVAVHLLDARSLPRFRGEQEPLDAKAGHIPGAQCSDFTGNLDENGHFLSPGTLAKRFMSLADDQPLVSYCGSGVTACHNILALTLAGHPLPRLYAGSWSEWITDPQRPIETDSTQEPL